MFQNGELSEAGSLSTIDESLANEQVVSQLDPPLGLTVKSLNQTYGERAGTRVHINSQ